MWSAVPAVKEGHRLRTSGPYAITRHPIYTGLLGMLLGTMLVAGAGEFPEEYPRYRRRVLQLVPGLRVVTGHPDVAG
jgi:protein-S-isoprenylcysteine O-methyltransferase Ste14